MLAFPVSSQNIQLHYDFRHSLDPDLNKVNFPVFSFEYFKEIDTSKTGSFLFKMESRLDGRKSNMGQAFVQISQSLKFWEPPCYMSFNYSGGLGIAEPDYGYYIASSFGLGLSVPFQWKNAWFSIAFSLRYNAFKKASYDPQLVFYFGRGFLNYKIFSSGSFVVWTQNKDQGDDFTRSLHGKKLAFFGDPQIWFNLNGSISAGTRINVYYHILSGDNRCNIYPTIGLKYNFR